MASAPKNSGVAAGQLAGLLEHFLTADDLLQLKRAQLLSHRRIRATRTGGHKARLRNGTTEFSEHRAYSPGDEVKRLDWRILGRSDKLEIKLYEDPSAMDNVLLVDASGSMEFADSTRSKFSHACSVTAFMAKLLLSQRDPVGLMMAKGPAVRLPSKKGRDSQVETPGDNIHSGFLPPKPGNAQLSQILTTLHRTRASGPTGLAGKIRHLARHLRNQTRVLIVSDALVELPPLEAELGRLADRGHRFVLLQTLAPEELGLRYNQPFKFTSLEDHEMIRANPSDIRESYLDALRRHIDGLRKICLHYRAGYEPLVTDRPVGRSLIEFIRRQSERKR
jgi:uncharacterized protein (DUF58 family)